MTSLMGVFGFFAGVYFLFKDLIARGIVIVIALRQRPTLIAGFFLARRQRLIFIRLGILLIAHCDQS